MKRLVECVPNFSEGRDATVVEEIARAIESVAGARVLHRHLDHDHHRSVLTFVAPPEAVGEAAVRGAGRAAELIDLRCHRGEHPRIGAADVIPFVPLESVALEDCAAIARVAGEEIWRRHRIPVYYYEAAARDPARAALEAIRRGGLSPDVGGPEFHPTAGASVVGARKILIAYNVYLDTRDVAIAKRIARQVRASSGGLPCVKALGVLVGGRAQVSMNLTDFETTPVQAAFEAVRAAALREGADVAATELVGLIPRRALEGARVDNLHPGLVLENLI
jgi:glutamate formiminotransferase